MTTNYWVIGGRAFVFFDDFEEQSVIRSFDQALVLQLQLTKTGADGEKQIVPKISSYRPRIFEGQWSGIESLFTESELPPRFAVQAAA